MGYSCEVDKDFTKDDLGGHCNGLSKAFNPRASFVCCRENPKNKDANKSPTTLQHIIDAGYSENQNHVYRYVRRAILEKFNAYFRKSVEKCRPRVHMNSNVPVILA